MRLSTSTNSRPLRLWKAATLGVPQMLARLLLWCRSEAMEAYQLHPRCCRTEQFLGSL
jgi:hypothetical protein